MISPTSIIQYLSVAALRKPSIMTAWNYWGRIKMLRLIKLIRGYLIGKVDYNKPLRSKLLIKIIQKLNTVVAKRASFLQWGLFNICEAKMRLAYENAGQQGHDVDFDDAVEAATHKFLNIHYFDDKMRALWIGESDHLSEIVDGFLTKYQNNKAMADEIIERASADSKLDTLLGMHLRVQSYLATCYNIPLLSELLFNKAKEVIPDAVVLGEVEIDREIVRRKKEYRLYDDQIADRHAVKLSFSMEEMTYFIAIFSSLMIACGYMYTYYFYSHFGFKVSDFFNVSDYLAVSIEKVHASLYSVAWTGIVWFMMLHSFSRSSQRVIEAERKQMRFLPYFVFFAFLMWNYEAFTKGGTSMSFAVVMDVMFISAIFGPRIAAKYFKNVIAGIFVIVLLSNWGARTFKIISDDIVLSEEAVAKDQNCGNVSFRDEAKLGVSSCDLVMIGANSTYAFFVYQGGQKSIAIPKTEIAYIVNEIPGSEASIYNKYIQPFVLIWDALMGNGIPDTEQTE